jgi:histidyl-tRNA synthetase
VESLEIHSVRGMNDVIPPARALQLAVQSQFAAIFDLYGYEAVDTPVLEPTDLFLRKSGEEIASRMYAFTHWNRNLCLRPEFTASVIRAYVHSLQDRALPVRLQYAGPTFRYEKPQRSRYRQFTEVGVECIGADGPAADAEILTVVRDGLEAVGLDSPRFVVGHLGAVLQLLAQLGMDARTQSLVLGVMDRLSRGPDEEEEAIARLAAILGAGDDADGQQASALAELLRAFGPEGATRIANDLLEQANLVMDGGSRSAREIVERILLKSQRPDPRPALRRAVDFIGRLRDSAGPPETALPALREVLSGFGLDEAPVREVEAALRFFDAHFDGPSHAHVNLAMARGLRYYTGLVFEVYDEEGNQVAGGGRYDDLVRALGGRAPIPACGFSYGLERVLAALEKRSERDGGKVTTAPRAAVVPISLDDYAAAAQLASSLRRSGMPVEMDLRFRGPRASLRHADRANTRFVLLVGEQERADGTVVLRDMSAFEESRVPFAAAADAIRQRVVAPVPAVAHG